MKTNEERIEDLEKNLADLTYLVLKQTKSMNTTNEIIDINIESINLLTMTVQKLSNDLKQYTGKEI